MMAICFPDFSASCRMSLMRFVWSFQSPWEKFSLAASMPARMSLAMIAGELDAGPMVAMILVRLRFDMGLIIAYSVKKYEEDFS
jgi:hypothetical protein